MNGFEWAAGYGQLGVYEQMGQGMAGNSQMGGRQLSGRTAWSWWLGGRLEVGGWM